MRRPRPKETDRIAEMRHQEKRASLFLDEELQRTFDGKLDRQMLCAGMTVWINARRELFKIENDAEWARIKKEGDELDRSALINQFSSTQNEE